MATAKKAPAAAGAATLPLPEGMDPAAAKHYAPGVALRFDTLPPKGGAVRLLLVAGKDCTAEQARDLLSTLRMGFKVKAPGVFEANLTLKDMDGTLAPHVGSAKMFKWVDLAHRLHGLPAPGAHDLVTIALAWEGSEADAKKKLKALGATLLDPATPPEGEEEGEWVDKDEGLILARLTARKLVDLVLTPKAAAIEVRSVGVAKTGA